MVLGGMRKEPILFELGLAAIVCLSLGAMSLSLTACPADDKTPTTGPSDPAGSEPPEPEPVGTSETGAAVEPEKPAK